MQGNEGVTNTQSVSLPNTSENKSYKKPLSKQQKILLKSLNARKIKPYNESTAQTSRLQGNYLSNLPKVLIKKIFGYLDTNNLLKIRPSSKLIDQEVLLVLKDRAIEIGFSENSRITPIKYFGNLFNKIKNLSPLNSFLVHIFKTGEFEHVKAQIQNIKTLNIRCVDVNVEIMKKEIDIDKTIQVLSTKSIASITESVDEDAFISKNGKILLCFLEKICQKA